MQICLVQFLNNLSTNNWLRKRLLLIYTFLCTVIQMANNDLTAVKIKIELHFAVMPSVSVFFLLKIYLHIHTHLSLILSPLSDAVCLNQKKKKQNKQTCVYISFEINLNRFKIFWVFFAFTFISEYKKQCISRASEIYFVS